eukprot:CAMPEP_0116099600 /NCGR_PEP_ID=MMETSP0327-20121206/11853_1 /TAXON_ID=44447 /ORGANISM="Pseudo-nitzschia delicatissima, Strain B596" /LENGTH=184 /DNA_ID=CAMNT_0003591485 /DNA_START=41 /DNA_END=591 /DNA_ORIENTATION=-
MISEVNADVEVDVKVDVKVDVEVDVEVDEGGSVPQSGSQVAGQFTDTSDSEQRYEVNFWPTPFATLFWLALESEVWIVGTPVLVELYMGNWFGLFLFGLFLFGLFLFGLIFYGLLFGLFGNWFGLFFFELIFYRIFGNWLRHCFFGLLFGLFLYWLLFGLFGGRIAIGIADCGTVLRDSGFRTT